MGMSGGNSDDRGRRSGRTTLSEINITPLVDVMLVLLIIFMVTAPMMNQGLDVNLPETANTGITVKEDPFIITIRKGDKIFIETNEMNLTNFPDNFKSHFSGN